MPAIVFKLGAHELRIRLDVEARVQRGNDTWIDHLEIQVEPDQPAAPPSLPTTVVAPSDHQSTGADQRDQAAIDTWIARSSDMRPQVPPTTPADPAPSHPTLAAPASPPPLQPVAVPPPTTPPAPIRFTTGDQRWPGLLRPHQLPGTDPVDVAAVPPTASRPIGVPTSTPYDQTKKDVWDPPVANPAPPLPTHPLEQMASQPAPQYHYTAPAHAVPQPMLSPYQAPPPHQPVSQPTSAITDYGPHTPIPQATTPYTPSDQQAAQTPPNYAAYDGAPAQGKPDYTAPSGYSAAQPPQQAPNPTQSQPPSPAPGSAQMQHAANTSTPAPSPHHSEIESLTLLPRLMVQLGDEIYTQYILADPETKIGRDGTNDLCLQHTSASRLHATITRQPDSSYVIRDAQSRNGTIVNGQPVDVHVLQHADEIDMGDFLLVYDVPGQNPPWRKRVRPRASVIPPPDEPERAAGPQNMRPPGMLHRFFKSSKG